jgi:hypothetical protein
MADVQETPDEHYMRTIGFDPANDPLPPIR